MPLPEDPLLNVTVLVKAIIRIIYNKLVNSPRRLIPLATITLTQPRSYALKTSPLGLNTSLQITFVFHFISSPLCRFTLYLVTSVLFFTSHPFCFSLPLDTTLSFHFVPRHFIPFHITSLLFFTSLGDNFVVSFCTLSLYFFSSL